MATIRPKLFRSTASASECDVQKWTEKKRLQFLSVNTFYFHFPFRFVRQIQCVLDETCSKRLVHSLQQKARDHILRSKITDPWNGILTSFSMTIFVFAHAFNDIDRDGAAFFFFISWWTKNATIQNSWLQFWKTKLDCSQLIESCEHFQHPNNVDMNVRISMCECGWVCVCLRCVIGYFWQGQIRTKMWKSQLYIAVAYLYVG